MFLFTHKISQIISRQIINFVFYVISTNKIFDFAAPVSLDS